MTLHIFNPEHDIALASGLANFTAPHAGRQLRHDLGFLPALWARKGDGVLVDDVAVAKRALRKLHVAADVALLDRPADADRVDAWGWDAALRRMLERRGVDVGLLPSAQQIDAIRRLSHRRTSSLLLPKLRREGTVGEAFECASIGEVEALAARFERTVLKAPWSSSGRGLRFVAATAGRADLKPVEGWLKNLLERQGSVMLEPYYNKVKDFGMEFSCTPDGTVSYEGLSLFHTQNGAYTGNIVATEQAKRDMLARYLPLDLIDGVRDDLCLRLAEVCRGSYEGPLGVDMMVVASADGKSAFRLHPCVEINLRRTMGHVALALASRVNPSSDDDVVRVMRIVYTDHYELKIQRL